MHGLKRTKATKEHECCGELAAAELVPGDLCAGGGSERRRGTTLHAGRLLPLGTTAAAVVGTHRVPVLRHDCVRALCHFLPRFRSSDPLPAPFPHLFLSYFHCMPLANHSSSMFSHCFIACLIAVWAASAQMIS